MRFGSWPPCKRENGQAPNLPPDSSGVKRLGTCSYFTSKTRVPFKFIRVPVGRNGKNWTTTTLGEFFVFGGTYGVTSSNPVLCPRGLRVNPFKNNAN